MLKLRIKTGLAERKTQGVRRRLSHKQQPSYQSSQSGFTIIESLMAIAVAGILLVGLSPLVALYVGARVQARRIDLATQAARSYIDGLQAGVITPPPPNQTVGFSRNNLAVDGTRSLPDQTTYPGTCFDANLNTLDSSTCTLPRAYLAIQALRDRSPLEDATKLSDDPNSPQKQGYCLAVRVYRADALDGNTQTSALANQNVFTGTLGNKQYPLVVMTTQIVNQTSFDVYQQRITTNSSPCKP